MRRFKDFQGSNGNSASIDISPLIDVVFILLIFFIVTTVFIDEPGVDVNKPRAASAETLETQAIHIAVTQNGEIWYANRVMSVEGIRAIISRKLQSDDTTPVIIQGDTASNYGAVMKVVDAAKLAGAKVSLATAN